MDINSESYLQIKGALEIPNHAKEEMSEEEMVIQIERRVAELMEQDFGLLMSYLYRLDVLEPHINGCLDPESPIHPYTCLAHLIWNRQKQRVQTKFKYRSDHDVEEGWEW
ncbi:hypothetical protein [Portibacter marinus]|uniref:hypothetical protein n=1 Tax=Portibacter marinus TaxID=2898660 RepID=UPI001F3FC8A2|nr:hypothetical protein [Portibacter marinus]